MAAVGVRPIRARPRGKMKDTMSRLFLSHSSADNPKAVAVRDWLIENGWNDVFLDLDRGGIKPGERWERALHEAASRCEAVIFLVSRSWLERPWCLNEFHLARRLNKRLFGALIDEIPLTEVPSELTGAWQMVQLASGQDHKIFRVTVPVSHEEVHVTFSSEGLARLKDGLTKAGLDPRFFSWPPESDPDRLPYRGLKPLEAEDAGIYFGREASNVEALDTLRGLQDKVPPRILVILGASGAGKSSFLRAGLLPRLARDERNFLPLPVMRPEAAALSGERGFISALAGAFAAQNLHVRRADVRDAVKRGAESVQSLLRTLMEHAVTVLSEGPEGAPKPMLILPIDQAEELFLEQGAEESNQFLGLLRDLVRVDSPSIIALFTIRSDSYDRLERAKPLEGLRQETFSLLPMPHGAYQIVIEGPLARLNQETRRVEMEPQLTHRLLLDIEEGGSVDALPLLAFTLEQLYAEYAGCGKLKLSDYIAFGGLRGAIEAAVQRAFAEADKDARIPRDRQSRLALLRRGLIPALAEIDPETSALRRRIARLADIPSECRPLLQLLVEQRLLTTDRVTIRESGVESFDVTIEPAHEALLRQWDTLRAWLEEDRGALVVLDGVKRAARDWVANGRRHDWLSHTGRRLEEAENVARRSDFAGHLPPDVSRYLAACHRLRRAGRLRLAALSVGIIALLCFTYLGVADDGVMIPGGDSIRLTIDRYGLSVFRPAHTQKEIMDVTARAESTSIDRTRADWISGAWNYSSATRTNGPKVAISPWVSAHAMAAVFRALGPKPQYLPDLFAALDAPFSPGLAVEAGAKKFGWFVGESDYPMAEPALWTVASLGAALDRKDLLDAKTRAHLMTELEYAETASDMYCPTTDGGWNILPQQDDPLQHDTYTTALGLLTMLQLRRAGLGWHGDASKLDQMIRASAAWLASQFDSTVSPAGWRVHLNDVGSANTGEVSDGLTLQIYSELLQAEAEANVPIPPAILAAIPHHINTLLRRPSDFATSEGIISKNFTNFDGQHINRTVTVTYLWYPWSIECTARWLDRLKRLKGPPGYQVQSRRTLGYLVVDLGAQDLSDNNLKDQQKTPTFVIAEQLYGLGSLSQLFAGQSAPH